jgi:Tfp pilus assembly protein PilO
MKIPVEGKSNLYRDQSSGAIINNDINAAEAFRSAARKRAADAARLNKLEDDMSEIKVMLKTLLKQTTKKKK